MQIFNTTTQDIDDIKFVVNGVDSAADLMQISTNGDFEYNTDKKLYQADDEIIQWWVEKLAEYQAMYRAINTKSRKYPNEVQAVLEANEGVEFNDYPAYVMAELDKIGIMIAE